MEKKYKVFYQGSLYGHFGRDRAGKEIEINKSFLWGGESWLVPSVYVCGKGLVADMFKKVSIESFREFIEKFGLDENSDCDGFSDEQQAEIEAENPLNSDIFASIQFGGRKPKKSDSLTLQLRAEKIPVPGAHFKANCPGDKTEFINPVTGKKHTLTVTAVEQQKFSKLRHIGGKEPPLCTIINYDISPEIPRDEISVNDRSKPEKPRGILAPRGKAASAIGIIGGADGPTVIVTSSASGRTACSSLYYEPEYEPDWCMVFYKKPKEDIEIELI